MAHHGRVRSLARITSGPTATLRFPCRLALISASAAAPASPSDVYITKQNTTLIVLFLVEVSCLFIGCTCILTDERSARLGSVLAVASETRLESGDWTAELRDAG